jgi:hypothetical protein
LVFVTGGLAGFYLIDRKRRRHADISGRRPAPSPREADAAALVVVPLLKFVAGGKGHVGAERLETALDRRPRARHIFPAKWRVTGTAGALPTV